MTAELTPNSSADRQHVLIIDDDASLLEMLRLRLNLENFKVSCATTPSEGLAIATSEKPDLIILDVMLPVISGLEVCKELKADPQTVSIPIILHSASGDENNIVNGLEMGADDYIVKSDSYRVVGSKVRAVLRRKGRNETADNNKVLQFKGLLINTVEQRAYVDNKPLRVSSAEYSLLFTLASKPGAIFTAQELARMLSNSGTFTDATDVDALIAQLKINLDGSSELIQQVANIGYKFVEPIAG